MKYWKIYRNKHTGFSLTELLLVISIAALIIIGSIISYNRISENNKITEEIKSITSIVSESEIFAFSNKFEKINNSTLYDLKIINSNNSNKNRQLKSSLSDGIDIETIYNNQDKAITHIKFTFNNFQSEYCSKFIQGIEKQADLITVEKRILKNHFDKNNFTEYNLALATSSCESISQAYSVFPLILIIPYN